ncbi:MAG TPA: hypothetical protein VMT00_16960 [Thermoanaerobaculia bacterium]|nr:hypothetical protein [Thermoanaerobaculia bacterium]
MSFGQRSPAALSERVREEIIEAALAHELPAGYIDELRGWL